LLIAERHSRLQDLIAARGMCDLDTLSRELGVSQSTIRRDLELLEQRGVVKRTHGGVVWLGDRTAHSTRPYAFDQRLTHREDAKRQIAHAARPFVRPGQTIVIDGGTTTFHLAQQLVGQRLQLVTNSLPIANLFLNDDNVEMIVIGGLLYPRYGVFLGPMAESQLATVHATTMFFGAAGILDGALYNQNLLLVESQRRMMQQAQEVILLVDSSKFGQQALARLCELGEVGIVVTDAGLPPEHRAAIEAAGCRLVIADES